MREEVEARFGVRFNEATEDVRERMEHAVNNTWDEMKDMIRTAEKNMKEAAEQVEQEIARAKEYAHKQIEEIKDRSIIRLDHRKQPAETRSQKKAQLMNAIEERSKQVARALREQKQDEEKRNRETIQEAEDQIVLGEFNDAHRRFQRFKQLQSIIQNRPDADEKAEWQEFKEVHGYSEYEVRYTAEGLGMDKKVVVMEDISMLIPKVEKRLSKITSHLDPNVPEKPRSHEMWAINEERERKGLPPMQW